LNLNWAKTIDVICLGKLIRPEAWTLGQVFPSCRTPQELEKCYQQAAQSSQPDAWLFWDAELGDPDPVMIESVLERPGDLWHAGLRLGMGGLPGAIDFIVPTWMLNRDPNPDIEATSWRISLRACLVRRAVLEQMGFIWPEFQTLAAAALEWGHRCISQGVIVRHVPALVATAIPRPEPILLPLEDELRFVCYRFGSKWMKWALLRSVLSGYASPGRALSAWQKLRQATPRASPGPFQRPPPSYNPTAEKKPARISVLIPTLERYDYLRTLLGQIRRQTLPPTEIIVVDQTAPNRRQPELKEEFGELPLHWFFRDDPGQCSSRNAGLQAAQGELILFLDDDDEAPKELFETLVAAMEHHRAEVISGVADENGTGPLPRAFTFSRASDVFPTNITLARREALARSGLFDLAYEHGARADGDLGMRVYLSGALMVLEPAARVIHHHAPSGGLRVHKARLITYASSRSRLTHRHLVSATEFYLARRYFSPRQVNELRWLNVLGTFSFHGSMGARLVKAFIGLALMPATLLTLRQHYQQAGKMMNAFPIIPELASK
jgi:GT2 family glycosyltransferase